MNEIEFAAKHEREWSALARTLDPPKGEVPSPADVDEVPRRFRRLAGQLAIARDRQYRTSLIDRLHALAMSAHFAVHGARAQGRPGTVAALWHFFVSDFPAEARRQWRFLAAAALAFFGPFLGGIVALQFFPDFVYYLVSPDTLARIQSMYAPDNVRLGAARDADSDVMMFGFYILNNVRIDLQCLAGGAFFGLGTLAALVGNGMFLGAISGYLTQIGYGHTFWGFVAGHSAPELLGLVLAGASGLMIGYALVAPGRQTRVAALRTRGRSAATLLYGAALMTTGAAVIEAFWSSRVTLPFEVKIAAGAVVALVVVTFLALGGRRGP
ncbi:MAG TPA: stage II sporulation protein M [Usitatibacter sp.]|nr:stage II sporulation protein M [Usitatibacter sp.]